MADTAPPPPLLLDRRPGGVVVLTLNNPERRNALDPPLVEALLTAASDLRADRTARCVVITGSGKAFCSGADLGALKAEVTTGTLARRDRLSDFYRVFLDIRQLPMPIIAAVNGSAIGAGLNLALCCDLRIAARSARFGASFVRLGIHAGGGATHMLTRLLGPASPSTEPPAGRSRRQNSRGGSASSRRAPATPARASSPRRPCRPTLTATSCPPTLFENVPEDHPLHTTEIFGPYAVLVPVSDEQTAVRMINYGRHGLVGAVYTRNMRTAMRCARDLKVGVVKVDRRTTGNGIAPPFGGRKDSSAGGYPEGGRQAVDFFTLVKTVCGF